MFVLRSVSHCIELSSAITSYLAAAGFVDISDVVGCLLSSVLLIVNLRCYFMQYWLIAHFMSVWLCWCTSFVWYWTLIYIDWVMGILSQVGRFHCIKKVFDLCDIITVYFLDTNHLAAFAMVLVSACSVLALVSSAMLWPRLSTLVPQSWSWAYSTTL